jgi:hypothetical protein
MTYLSEDPTFLAVVFLVLAGISLAALKVTQHGKYLVHAGIALGLGLAVFVVDWFWVTDTERIERVVYDLQRAVANSDADAVISHLAPNVQYLQGDTALSEEAPTGRYSALRRSDSDLDPYQSGALPFRLRSNQRFARQRHATSTPGNGRVPRFRSRKPEFVVGSGQ